MFIEVQKAQKRSQKKKLFRPRSESNWCSGGTQHFNGLATTDYYKALIPGENAGVR